MKTAGSSNIRKTGCLRVSLYQKHHFFFPNCKVDVKKLYNAEPAMEPAPRMYRVLCPSSPLSLTTTIRIIKATITVIPVIVLPTSIPVAKSTPSCFFGPPMNWSIAPGIAKIISHFAIPGLEPASIVVTNVRATGANRSYLKYVLHITSTTANATKKDTISAIYCCFLPARSKSGSAPFPRRM